MLSSVLTSAYYAMPTTVSRRVNSIFSFALLILAVAFVAPIIAQNTSIPTNGTATGECPIEVPGFTHRGNCNLLCRPAIWTDILVFFIGNYVAHAATVISRPGQSILASVLNVATALLFPGGGIRSGVEAIWSLAKFAPTDLQAAARAGALCAVVERPESIVARWSDRRRREAEIAAHDKRMVIVRKDPVSGEQRIIGEERAATVVERTARWLDEPVVEEEFVHARGEEHAFREDEVDVQQEISPRHRRNLARENNHVREPQDPHFENGDGVEELEMSSWRNISDGDDNEIDDSSSDDTEAARTRYCTLRSRTGIFPITLGRRPNS